MNSGGAENQENIDTLSAGTPKQMSKRSKKTAPKAPDARDGGILPSTPSFSDGHDDISMDVHANNPSEDGKEILHNHRR